MRLFIYVLCMESPSMHTSWARVQDLLAESPLIYLVQDFFFKYPQLLSHFSSHSNCSFKQKCMHSTLRSAAQHSKSPLVYAVLKVISSAYFSQHKMWKLSFSSVRKWIGNYFYFSKATLCIRGLVFSHTFVNYAVLAVLMTYLTNVVWKPASKDELQLAAVAINMLNGISGIMVCFLAFISNSTVGPFKVIASTNAACLLGLVLLWSSMQWFDSSIYIFYGASILLALGKAGGPAALGKFLDDQYLSEVSYNIKLPKARNAEEDYKKKRIETRQTALWIQPWYIGLAAPLALVKIDWPTQLAASIIVLAISYLFFWYGIFAYSRNIRNESNDPAAEDTLSDQGLVQAVKSLSPSKETAASWRFWLKPVSRKHYYKEMLVVCLAFIVNSLVDATGNTFFFNQMILLNRKVGDFKIPTVYFGILQSLSSFVISFLWRRLVPKQTRRATLVKIGCGLVCSVLCMVAAWQVEIQRKNKIYKEYRGDNKPEHISMSILWLVPQFTLLGFMKGLAADGLVEFFADRVDANGRRKAMYYGSYACKLVLGIGTLLTAVSILVFRSYWLATDESYNNQLDKYYRVLVTIGVANLCYYFCVAVYFYTKGNVNLQVGCEQDGNDQSDKPHQQDASIGALKTPEREDLESSTFACCGSFY